MANIKSNKKRHIQDKKKSKQNHSLNSKRRTIVKKTRLSKKPEDLSLTYSVADKDAKVKRIHKNKANRIKSRIAKAINKN